MRPILTGVAATLLICAAIVPAHADCTCRARGVVAAHGQTVCILTPNGTRLARCDKISNVASWTFLEAPCPQALSVETGVLASMTPASQTSRILR
jgi:hypothetical protein